MLNDEAKRLIDHARREFIAKLGIAPKFGAIAPGRVNLIGEHTDYNDGFVMPLAIGRYTVAVGAATSQPFSTLHAADLNQAHCVELTKPLEPIGNHFADYVLAVIDQFKKRGVAVPNIDLLIAGNIPRGAGLSSSASLEVAIALLMEQITGAALMPAEHAALCHRAECEFVGVPCGIMDMFIIAAATKDTAMLLDSRCMHHETVPLPLGNEITLLVIDTGVERSLRNSEYAERRKTCETAAAKLGASSLRDATLSMLTAANLTSHERMKARHVIEENMRVLAAAAALRRNDYAALGNLMFQSHASLRDLYQVSCPELDAVVSTAHVLEKRGVHGARMTGAGFGGCAIILCDSAAAAATSKAIVADFSARFARSPIIFPVTATCGASSIK